MEFIWPKNFDFRLKWHEPNAHQDRFFVEIIRHSKRIRVFEAFHFQENEKYFGIAFVGWSFHEIQDDAILNFFLKYFIDYKEEYNDDEFRSWGSKQYSPHIHFFNKEKIGLAGFTFEISPVERTFAIWEWSVLKPKSFEPLHDTAALHSVCNEKKFIIVENRSAGEYLDPQTGARIYKKHFSNIVSEVTTVFETSDFPKIQQTFEELLITENKNYKERENNALAKLKIELSDLSYGFRYKRNSSSQYVIVRVKNDGHLDFENSRGPYGIPNSMDIEKAFGPYSFDECQSILDKIEKRKIYNSERDENYDSWDSFDNREDREHRQWKQDRGD